MTCFYIAIFWSDIYDKIAANIFHVGLFQSAALYLNSALIFLVIVRYQKGALQRLKWHALGRRWIVVSIVLVYFLWPIYDGAHMPTKSVGYFLTTLLMAIGVGLNEELFSRGLILSYFEKFGSGWAFWVSSLTFGAFHLLNIIYGSNPVGAIYQAIHATGAGFIFAGLLLYTRSIWIPVLYHAANDFPLLQYHSSTSDNVPFEWSTVGGLVMEALFALAIGGALYYFSKDRFQDLTNLAVKYKLVEA